MKKTFIVVLLLVLAAILLGARFIGGPEDTWLCDKKVGWVKHGNPSAPMPSEPCKENTEPAPAMTYRNASSDLIVVELPFPGAVTGKDFAVIGKARGFWFFEASFPIEVLDKDGKLLASGVAQAQGEWMTEDFVPFKADLKVPQSYIGEATLILKKDNPSGLPENDASASFPFTVEY